MEIKTSTQGEVALLEPTGSVDTRGAGEFERKVLELLAARTRLFVVDFSHVDLITSAGIRVLVMLGKRLSGNDGGLVLCALNEQVKKVFDIAGLSGHFALAPDRERAVALLTSRLAPGSPEAVRAPKLHRLVLHLLGDEGVAASGREKPGPRATAGGASRLAARVVELLNEAETKARHPDG